MLVITGISTGNYRSRHHNKNVSWLRKTEYISTEYNRFTQSAEKAESRYVHLHLLYRNKNTGIVVLGRYVLLT